VHLGVVDPKCFDLDDHMTGLGLRLGNVLVNQTAQSTEFL